MAWSDHVALRLEVASAGETGPGGQSRWTAPSDEYKYRWTPASTDATGAPGRWEATLNIRAQNWTDWSTIPWFDVLCDTMTVETAQGWSPFESNASPNSATFLLVDPDQNFLPGGPDRRGLDVGFDLPIRLVADWHDTDGGEVVVWAGLIREVVWSATPGGVHTATIRATEVTEVYGRTDPEQEGAVSRPKESVFTRLDAIHAVSDMPNLFAAPISQSPKGPGNWYEGTASEWTPPTGSGTLYNWGTLASPDAYASAALLDKNLWSDICHWINALGNVTAALNYTHSPSATKPGTPALTMVPPLAVRYPKQQHLVIAADCSDPAGYPFAPGSAYPPSPTVTVSPTSLQITASQASIANDVKVALEGTTGMQAHKVNQASVDQYGRHTWGRNDIRLTWVSSSADLSKLAPQVAWRYTLRTSMARDKLEQLELPVTNRRDLQGLVGWHYRASATEVPQVLQPGRTAILHWDQPDMADHALLITRVEHSITPDQWTTRLSCEMFDMDHFYGKELP